MGQERKVENRHFAFVSSLLKDNIDSEYERTKSVRTALSIFH